MRIRYFEELEREDKHKFEVDAYTNISMLSAKQMLKVFDGYRQLRIQLEEEDIYCLDREKAAKDRTKAIILGASFPKTYRRSSMGMSLTENEIKTRFVLVTSVVLSLLIHISFLSSRTAELNFWMGRLLLQYHEFHKEAQELINEFLNLDDSPAEPQNAFILSM
jgi:hypothetical protein